MNQVQDIPQLAYHRLRFHFQAPADIVLHPYKGSPWRGLFGHALRVTFCPFKLSHCQSCLLQSQCLYLQLFESPISLTTRSISGATTYLPHPIILTPPLDWRTVIPKGEQFTSEMTLLVPSFAALPYLIVTFEKMGQRGIGKPAIPFKLISVQVSHQEQWLTLFDHQQHELLPLPPPFLPSIKSESSAQQVTLHWLTPLHLKVKQQRLNELTFEAFIQGLFRRVKHLTQLYGQEPFSCDVKPLLELASAITMIHTTLHRYIVPRVSARQQQKMQFHGLLGQVTYQGKLEPFVPWLKLGEALHIGNLTSFGFGKYQLEWHS